MFPISRIISHQPKNNEAALRTELDLIEETREAATLRASLQKLKAAKYHNARVKERTFKVGDDVMRKVEATA
ncbi:hypothetical protein Tsubulata_037409 [Turnera subulata]|uniref:Uncharacterized protein n=1 Tax=Turnera subulata TaxID=218843 RepID=A0A9Q0FY67_9ROSI|nr:hypothetical protein Tsubulata_037409 [Turnera subulata]